MGVLTFLCFIFDIFFLKLIVTCRLCVIYEREDHDSNVEALVDYMDLAVRCPQRGR